MADATKIIVRTGSGGLSLPAVLGVVFITLKLLGVITWSWWWVASPFWIPTALVIAIIAIFLVVALFAGIGAGAVLLIIYLLEKRDEKLRLKERQDRIRRGGR